VRHHYVDVKYIEDAISPGHGVEIVTVDGRWMHTMPADLPRSRYSRLPLPDQGSRGGVGAGRDGGAVRHREIVGWSWPEYDGWELGWGSRYEVDGVPHTQLSARLPKTLWEPERFIGDELWARCLLRCADQGRPR
jgi:hypothetical protein